ncbi:MAG: diguanylate cyclase, partial [Limnobacter sp.]|nr:diguanylate cyclase [Limnobacter sp.]
CKRIVSAFDKEPLFKRILQNHGLSITCSLGVAMFPELAKSVQELIDQADSAMYEAKRSGKNCYRVAQQRSAAAEPEGAR